MLQEIKNSWSLLTFAKSHGKMQIGDFVNKESGEMFKSCIFTTEDGSRCFVAFSSRLGELSAQEIKNNKDELRIVELASGNLILCKQGQNQWIDVDLGL